MEKIKGVELQSDNPIHPRYHPIPMGNGGYWWEGNHTVVVPFIYSKNPIETLKFLRQIESMNKPVFFPTIINYRLEKLLKKRGYIPAKQPMSKKEQKLYGQKYIYGFCRLPE